MKRQLASVVLSGILLVLTACVDRYANPPYSREGEAPARVLVLYYSRSGNTETMAQTIARKFDAELLALETDDYALGFAGYLSAAWDAIRRRPAARVAPEKIDFAGYDLVFLGGPIWYWRPAPPLWTFAAQNDFQGAAVVPFFTMKSDYSEEMAAELAERIEASGGVCPGHLPLKHGGARGEAVARLTEALLDAHADWWEGALKRAARP